MKVAIEVTCKDRKQARDANSTLMDTLVRVFEETRAESLLSGKYHALRYYDGSIVICDKTGATVATANVYGFDASEDKEEKGEA